MFATHSTVAAAFDDPADAQVAMYELRRDGFNEQQIGYMGRHAGPGYDIPLALTAWGMDEDEAEKYDAHFHAGRTVVVVEAGDRAGEAHSILHHHRPREDSFAGIGIFGHDLPATPY